jgi:hypothetical protein
MYSQYPGARNGRFQGLHTNAEPHSMTDAHDASTGLPRAFLVFLFRPEQPHLGITGIRAAGTHRKEVSNDASDEPSTHGLGVAITPHLGEYRTNRAEARQGIDFG